MDQLWIILLGYAPGIIFSIIVGLGFGSYSTMAAYRLPRGERWIGLKPRCLHCEHVLVLRDFFPIISWFKAKRGCAYCGKAIDLKMLYLFVEVATVLASVAAYLWFGFGELYLLIMGLSISLIIVMATDIELRIMPDKPLLCILVLGVMYRILQDHSIYGVIEGGAIAVFVALALRMAYYRITNQQDIAYDFAQYGTHDSFAGVGFQYVKLAAISGIWLGAYDALIWSCISIIALIIMLPWQKTLSREGLLPLSVPMGMVLLAMLYYQHLKF